MKRYLKPWQVDALDEQDRQNKWGRYEGVVCTDGVVRPKWMLQMFAADRAAKEKLKNGALFMGRFIT